MLKEYYVSFAKGGTVPTPGENARYLFIVRAEPYKI